MSNPKKSFIAYSNWKEVFDELPDEDAGKLIKHIFAYVNDENPVSDSILIRAVFANIKTTLERDLAKWESQLQQRREAGKISAAIRNPTKSNDRSTTVKTRARNPTVNVNVNDNVIVNEKAFSGSGEPAEIPVLKKVSKGKKDSVSINPLHTKIKETFIAFFSAQKSTEYYWQAKDGKKTNSIIAKLRHVAEKDASDERLLIVFKRFLEIIDDPWILNNLEMSTLDSKFTTIIANSKRKIEKKQPELVNPYQ